MKHPVLHNLYRLYVQILLLGVCDLVIIPDHISFILFSRKFLLLKCGTNLPLQIRQTPLFVHFSHLKTNFYSLAF